ncbi:hypothetical protein BJ878DRAFT_544778 [Calycina marina]|uniref:Uncharacterized protein n=1 Tax=Calycina marina TaxID=1763456 RepID=A0A9P7YXZ6_9HELO|nr:hypothetical protein BJ878DRAFT_544778 [Calycina marina]
MSLRVRRDSVVSTSAGEPILVAQSFTKKLSKKSKIPKPLQFPLVVLLSFTVSSLLGTLVPVAGNESLRRVTKTPDAVGLAVLLGWRVTELAVGWFGDYDRYDLAALSLLSQGPPLYLLGTFYNIQPQELAISLFLNLAGTYIPFALLRPLSSAHKAGDALPPGRGDVSSDYIIQGITTLLGAAIYSVTLQGAYGTFLPVTLVTHFENLVSIIPAHTASLVSLFPQAIVCGLAAKTFIFTPASTLDSSSPPFNALRATLLETFCYNIWGFSKATKTVIKRTAALSLISGGNTFVQTFVAMEGVELLGAAGYSSVWVVAASVTGLALAAVNAG